VHGADNQCILQLADEHVELIANLGCMLAKHRKSDTVDRKDLQLAYGGFRAFTSVLRD